MNEYFEFHPSQQIQKEEKHRNELSQKGLDYFRYFILPAAGPKAFVSSGFEYALKNTPLTTTKWFVGGSTGALRALAYVSGLRSGKDLTSNLKDHYCEMYYHAKTTPACLDKMMKQLFVECAPPELIATVLNQDDFKFAIMVTQVPSAYKLMPDFALKALLGLVAVGNALSPRVVQFMFQRVCFYTGHSPPPCLVLDKSIEFCKLTERNIYQVLHATTNIPFLSVPCTFIDGRGSGLYFDGGMTDYYLNIQIRNPFLPALLLGDTNPESFIVRNAFDIYSPLKRKLPDAYFENCSVVRPTTKYTNALPLNKLPSVSDWFHPVYIREPTKRHSYWNTAFEISKQNWIKSISSYTAQAT